MRNSWEVTLEAYGIELMRTDPRLKGLNIVHSDNDARVNSKAIVVTATQGEAELDGVAGFKGELTFEYRGSVRSTAAQNDLVALAMQETILASPSRPTKAQLAFQTPLVLLNEDMSTDRPDTKDSRRRVLKIPVIARLR